MGNEGNCITGPVDTITLTSSERCSMAQIQTTNRDDSIGSPVSRRILKSHPDLASQCRRDIHQRIN